MSEIFAGLSSNEQYKSQAEIAEYNAKVAKQESLQRAGIIRRKTRKDIGSAVANYTKSGVEIEGSALDVIGEISAIGELNALTTETKGTNQANLLKYKAQSARSAGRMAIVGGIIGQVSSSSNFQEKFGSESWIF